MYISNVRLGFATNSSSTHSIIRFQGKTMPKDKALSHYEYGWETFTLASKQAKAKYLATQVYHSLEPSLGVETAVEVASSLVAPIPKGASIDHQSAWVLPANWDGKGVNLEFLRAIEAILYQPDVVVLGGSDNGSEGAHPLRASGQSTPLARLPHDSARCSVARRDGDYWVLFSRYDGTKVRLSFADAPPPYTKSSLPELVDMKITDQCSSRCPYCYQDSKPDGQHAARSRVERWLYALAALQVFEVAFGGGDPVRHPDFFSFVRVAKDLGVVPNFSTRELGWLRSDRDRKSVIESCGRVGFSVDNRAQVDRVMVEVLACDFPRDRVSLHYVLGSGYGYDGVLASASYWEVPVVLLGYKRVGRGQCCSPLPHDDWIEVIQSMNRPAARKSNVHAQLMAPTVSIDTALAKLFAKKLDAAQVPRLLWTTEEGMFSCYVDALNDTMGPSSFCAPEQMVKLDLNKTGDLAKKLTQAFDKLPGR